MTSELRAKQHIGTWLTRASFVVLALLSCTAAEAQNQYAVVHSDANYVGLADDAYVGDLDVRPAFEVFEENYQNDVAQVGCFSSKPSHASCDGCGSARSRCCCKPWWAHRCGAFGEYLLLRPGSADQIYTIEQNDVVPGAFPTGPVGRTNIDEESGYRVGASIAAGNCQSLVAGWTKFSGSTQDQITAAPGNFLNSQIIHPSTLTTGATSLQSAAASELDFQLLDLSYRRLFKGCNTYAINWLAGFRYGQMEQSLRTQQQVSVATGLVSNNIGVDFNGFGTMFGIDAERRNPCNGLMIYSKGLASFLAGDWKGSYTQTNQFGGGVVANQYEDYRITPVLELELGFGWRSKCGRCRASVGYMSSAWYNSISTREYVNAVRRDNYVSVDDTITFSGLTSRVEVNF